MVFSVMHKAIFFSLLFTLTSLSAEVVDGPAHLRDQPNGEIILSLNDGVSVEVLGSHKDWFNVRVVFAVKQEQFGSQFLSKGSILYDHEGNRIGETLQGQRFSSYSQHQDWVFLETKLYTSKGNIVTSSLLENEVVRLIQSQSLNIPSLSGLEYMNLAKIDDQGQFDLWVVYEPIETVFGKEVRIGFVANENRILALLGSPKFENHQFQSIRSVRYGIDNDSNYMIYFFDPFDNDEVTAIHHFINNGIGLLR